MSIKYLTKDRTTRVTESFGTNKHGDTVHHVVLESVEPALALAPCDVEHILVGTSRDVDPWRHERVVRR